ncbi:TPA: Ig domain-containing protein [Clostridium botulinum]|nr:Ig domain-containing protein [Clostridium botulinum]
MKKKIGLIMSMVLLFVFVLSGINNTYVAHAEKNNDFVIGTHNLNNTEKNSAKVGDVLKEPEIGWKRYDDKNNNISYIGNWRTSTESGSLKWNGSNQISNIINDKIQFKFTGDKIRIITSTAIANSNNIKIKIDNDIIDAINMKTTNINYQALAYEKAGMVNKEHSLEIINLTNDYITLDAIDIDKNGELKPYKEAVKAESITLDKTSMDLIEGSSDKLNAKVLPEDATNKKVAWSSSDEKIVTVDKDGKVTAIKEGKATITAKVEGTDLAATCKVNVTKKVEENKNNAILSISLVNGATKEYDVSMQEVEKFINWFEERSNGKGPSLYSFNKKINPYKTVKEYIVHDKIASFEVREYEGTNK